MFARAIVRLLFVPVVSCGSWQSCYLAVVLESIGKGLPIETLKSAANVLGLQINVKANNRQ